MNASLLSGALLLIVLSASGQGKPPANSVQTEIPDATSGKNTYMEYCAACHGDDGKGMGPAASALKTPPPDPTTLAKRHGDKFPEEYVAEIVRLGKPIHAHGSVDMPIWGPIFSAREKFNEVAVRRRIKNLCSYLAILQEKNRKVEVELRDRGPLSRRCESDRLVRL